MRRPRLLSRPWIFVSHSTKDISKVRLIRNYLEREGAEPLLFRLKFLDKRNRMISPLLRAEMRARQVFLLCNSRNAQGSPWVKEEIDFILKQPNKIRCVIHLDPPTRWTVPRTDLDTLLRQSTAILSYAWSSRSRVRALLDEITIGLHADERVDVVGDGEGGVISFDSGEGDDDGSEAGYTEPPNIDFGFRGFDDRITEQDRRWADAAVEAAQHGRILIHCMSRDFRGEPLSSDDSRLDDLRRASLAYDRCFVLDLDECWLRQDPPGWLRDAEWIVLRGTLRQQLEELVQALRGIDALNSQHVGKVK